MGNTVRIIGRKLEPVYCKKRQKIVPDQLLVWGKGPSEGFEWYQTEPR